MSWADSKARGSRGDARGDAILPAAQGLSIHLPHAVQRRLNWELGERGITAPQPFHLTLKYAFVPFVDLTERLQELERLVASQPSLRLTSAGLLPSPETYCHLLLIHRSPELMRLHEDVMALFGSCGRPANPETSRFEGPGYNPHVTLSYGSCVADFEIQDAHFTEYAPSIQFEAKSVTLYEKPTPGKTTAAAARSFRFAEPK